jgi:hypothetical protein
MLTAYVAIGGQTMVEREAELQCRNISHYVR